MKQCTRWFSGEAIERGAQALLGFELIIQDRCSHARDAKLYS